MARSTARGIVCRRWEGGSRLRHPACWRLSRKSTLPFVNRGSGAPTEANAWPTRRTASSAVRPRTCLPLGARIPSCHYLPNNRRTQTGSSNSERPGSMLRVLQKLHQIRQADWPARTRFGVTPWAISESRAARSAARRLREVASQAATFRAVGRWNRNE